jgi:hypothetical protein
LSQTNPQAEGANSSIVCKYDLEGNDGNTSENRSFHSIKEKESSSHHGNRASSFVSLDDKLQLQRIIISLRTAVEVVRKRLEILDETAPLMILQCLARCHRFLYQVECLIHQPLANESMFYAHLAIHASAVFEAWQTTLSGKRDPSPQIPALACDFFY